MPDTMSIKSARAIVGGLSEPSKMPGFAWSIPPKHCKSGATLAGIAGSVCFFCYAMKNRYAFPTTIEAMERRFVAWRDDPMWFDAMLTLLRSKAVMGKGVFRWFDAGDLQSEEHLGQICELARQTPELRHWLPTREAQILKSYVSAGNKIPSNLTVRLSAPMVDGSAPKWWKWTSGVHQNKEPLGRECPAPKQDGKCGDCRACWDRSVRHVSYHAH